MTTTLREHPELKTRLDDFTHLKRLEAPSLGKAAKLESRPENANRANPELRALGHQAPGRAEWGKKIANTPKWLKQRATIALEPRAWYGREAHMYLARQAEGASARRATQHQSA